jgi:pyruvate formate lyase activating enzyme
MADLPPTSLERLKRAKRLADEAGIHYAYVGNTDLEGAENTYCPQCRELLIQRNRFGIEKNVFKGKKFEDTRSPRCPACSQKINLVL